MHCTDYKKLEVNFKFDCSTIDLCSFHLSHILWWVSWYYNLYFALFCGTVTGNALIKKLAKENDGIESDEEKLDSKDVFIKLKPNTGNRQKR